jgi:hypothetical protein
LRSPGWLAHPGFFSSADQLWEWVANLRICIPKRNLLNKNPHQADKQGMDSHMPRANDEKCYRIQTSQNNKSSVERR